MNYYDAAMPPPPHAHAQGHGGPPPPPPGHGHGHGHPFQQHPMMHPHQGGHYPPPPHHQGHHHPHQGHHPHAGPPPPSPYPHPSGAPPHQHQQHHQHHPGMMAMMMCHPTAAAGGGGGGMPQQQQQQQQQMAMAPPHHYHDPHRHYHHHDPSMALPPHSAPAPAAAAAAATSAPSHLPAGVRVPTPRAVSLEVQPFAEEEEESAAGAGVGGEGGEDEASVPAPMLMLQRPESVEPAAAAVQPQPPVPANTGTIMTANTAPTAASTSTTMAPLPIPAPAVPATAPFLPSNIHTMMLAAAAAMPPSLTPTAGTRLPAEEVAAYLLTLKHRSVSPDLVDDTASCLASMKMPHLMPMPVVPEGTDSSGSGDPTSAGTGTGNSIHTSEGQVLKFRDTPRTLGLPMATPEDRFWLSDVSCFVRANCCEFFVAEGEEDNLTKTRSKSGKEFTTTAGRRSKVTAGRVGIRCVFCRDGLNKVVQSTSFPNKIANIYSAIIMMQCRHFPSCPFMPPDVRSRLEAIKAGAPMAMPPMVSTAAAAAAGSEEEDIVAAQQESLIVSVEGTDDNVSASANDETNDNDDGGNEDSSDADNVDVDANNSDATTVTAKITNANHTSAVPVVSSNNSNAPGRQVYWSNSARKLGLVDTENDGIRFAPGVDYAAMVEKAQAEKIEAARQIREAVAAAAAADAVYNSGLPPTANHFMPLDVNVNPSGSFDSHSDVHSMSSATLVSRSSASAASASTAALGKGGRKKKAGAPKADLFPQPAVGIETLEVPDMDDEATVRNLMGVTDLVELGDKDLIPSYIFLAFAQLKRCNLTEPDRVGCYKDRELGFTGMSCKHCGGAPGFGKYFPGTVRSLAQTTTSQTILKHVGGKCRMTPPHVRKAIMALQAQEDSEKAAYARGTENDGRPRYGSRKVFFARLFNTLHGLPAPPLPSPEELAQTTSSKPKAKAKKKRSSSTSSTSTTSKKSKSSPSLLPSLPPLGAVVSEDSADMLPPSASSYTVGGNCSDQENKA